MFRLIFQAITRLNDNFYEYLQLQVGDNRAPMGYYTAISGNCVPTFRDNL